MGCCCSCCGSGDDGGAEDAKEMELQAQRARKALSVSAKMSAPTITKARNGGISGQGLALVGVVIEQDAAYWEWHMTTSTPQTTMEKVLFGVASKKDPEFYKELKDKVQPEEGTRLYLGGENLCSELRILTFLFACLDDPGTPSQVNGTQWMRQIDVENGDVIGVAVQQSDLPMVQFTLNGEALHMSAINRFRGSVYPAIYLPLAKEKAGEDGDTGVVAPEIVASLVVDEASFKHTSPGQRFQPLIVARSIV